MTPHEVAALLAYAGRLDPRTAPTDPAEVEARLTQWCDLLAEVPAYAHTGRGWDAARIVREHITTSPYPLLPVDITRRWNAHSRDLLARHTDRRPTADPDDDLAYRTALAADRQAVAAGQAAPAVHRELTSGPAAEVEARLAAIGRYIPAAARAALAPYRPTRATREAAIRAGQPDALAVDCGWCRAPTGEPCRSRRANPNGAGSWRRRSKPHPSRIDTAREATAA